MARILVTEEIADGGLDRLRAAGHDVDVQLGLVPERAARGGPGRPRADHPLGHRRSPPRCSRPAADLVVVGRAGIGLDNVDVDGGHRPRRDGGQRPAVEHPLGRRAHDGAAARPGPQRPPGPRRARRPGRWERSRWEGVELADKTLGIVGLGRIGKLVAQRALAFGMRLVAYDPFVSPERARQMGVELLDARRARAPSPTSSRIHLPKTPETIGLIDAELLAKAKPGLRIINVARGGIVDEAAWPRPSRDGHHRRRRARRVRQGADHRVAAVRARPGRGHPAPRAPAPARPRTRPATPSPSMVQLALAGEFVPFAVNVDAAEAHETVRPFLPLAERLGRAVRRRSSAACADALEIEYQGEIAELRHPHPHAVGAQGLLRARQRRAGLLRERAAAGRGAGHRGPRDATRPRRATT